MILTSIDPARSQPEDEDTSLQETMDDESTFEICEEDEVFFLSDDDVVTRRPLVNSEDEADDEEDFDPSKKTANFISLTAIQVTCFRAR